MPALGIILVVAGIYFIYAAVTNQAPVKTLNMIVQNPTQALSILREKPVQLAGASARVSQASGEGPSAVVAFARSKIGQRYVFGGHSDAVGWDCSGLTMEAYKYGMGITLAHSATAQMLDPRGRKVSKDELQPGDLVFPNNPAIAGGHVQIYSGGGNIIEAPNPTKPVREVPMWGFYTARRFTPAESTVQARGRVNA